VPAAAHGGADAAVPGRLHPVWRPRGRVPCCRGACIPHRRSHPPGHGLAPARPPAPVAQGPAPQLPWLPRRHRLSARARRGVCSTAGAGA
jgi:hypothetical protein